MSRRRPMALALTSGKRGRKGAARAYPRLTSTTNANRAEFRHSAPAFLHSRFELLLG